MIIVGILAACAHGCMMPLMTIVFGDLTSTFINNDQFNLFWDKFGNNVTAGCPDIGSKEDAQADPERLL